ncbi:MAG: AAA family ATPase [Paracoccaceae bacterium]
MEELEVDKIPNVPHPRTNKKIYGHNKAKNLFLKSLKIGKLHHAWLIHGPKGVGKATLAWKIAKLLQNGFKDFDKIEEESELSLISRRIEALSEQSILLCRRQFDKTKKRFLQEISVDEIRKINHFFSLSNTSSNYRIVIIDNINELSIAASNALLKILEEPPSNGVFILISENKRSILPTILSRCRILECNSLKFVTFQKVMLSLNKNNFPIDQLKKLYNISGGSIGKALEIDSNNGLKIFDKLVKILISEDEPTDENIWELLMMNHSFETTKEYHKFLFDLLLSAIRQITISLVTNQKTSLIEYDIKENKKNEKNDCEKYFPYSLIYSKIIEDLNDALKVNLNLSDILFTTFLKIKKINKIFRSI